MVLVQTTAKIDSTLLLANQSRMQDLFCFVKANKSDSGMSSAIYGLIILTAIVAVLFLLSIAIKWVRQNHKQASPLSLFLSLCRAHKLKYSEYWLLWQVAKFQHLTDPARLFLEPERFDGSRLSQALKPQTEQLKFLRNRLFADLEDNNTKNKNHTTRDNSSQQTGIALPKLNAAPLLDIPPWQTPTPPSSTSMPSSEV
jgi:hypothetical protein